jgi:hypothetical protein
MFPIEQSNGSLWMMIAYAAGTEAVLIIGSSAGVVIRMEKDRFSLT